MGWLTVLSVIWGILNIILFFKIWDACDNIKRIANKYAPESNKHTTPETREDIDKWLQNKHTTPETREDYALESNKYTTPETREDYALESNKYTTPETREDIDKWLQNK